MDFRQLLPEPSIVEVEDLLARLAPGEDAPAERPYTLANFASTVDGRATIGGRSGPIGDDGDRAMFHGLREQVDAVMAGTGTLRAETYGRVLGKEERRRRRVERGLSAEPLACIISRSGDVPLGIPLFAEPEANVVIFTTTELDTSACAAHVDVIVLRPHEQTTRGALTRLRSDFGVRSLLCEGGPTLFAALLRDGFIDELFLTLAPKLAGGGHAPAITDGPEPPDPAEMELRWLLERNGSLYLRYACR
jgi:riboflavin-specific deaminase-like protein